MDGTDTGSFSPDERLWIESSLAPLSADDGQPVAGGLQQVRQHLPSWVVSVKSVRAGSLSAADFDVLVMREEVSTAITPEEATAFRHAASPAP